jgi:hypothetical protein
MWRKCDLSPISAACEKRYRRTTPQRGLCNASALDTSSVTAVMLLGVWPAVTSTHLGSVSLQSSSLSAAAAVETKLQTIVVAVSGKKQRRPLQSERKGSAAERMASSRTCQRPNQEQLSLLPNRRNLALVGTTLSEAAASPRLMLRPVLHPLDPTQRPTRGQRKPACPEVSVVESQPPSSKQTDSAPSPPQCQSPLEGLADLFENLPTKACVELTRRLLSAAYSLPTGEARPRADLKTVILFTAEYVCAAWDKGLTPGLLER